jgi:hypothetical protein
MSAISKSIIQYLIPVVLLIAITCIYFYPQLEGKVVKQGDIVQYSATAQEQTVYREKEGRDILWTNSMFGGMPMYQIGVSLKNNFLVYAQSVMSLFIDRPIGYFLIGALSFYIMMLALGLGPWLSFIGSILFAFTTNNLILFEAGHTSKLAVILVSPLIIAGMSLLLKQKYLIGAGVYGVGFGLSILNGHLQMTYYLGLILGVFFLTYIIVHRNQWLEVGKTLSIIAVMTLLGLGASASQLWTTWEYSKETTRGTPILKPIENQEASNSSATKSGLDWDYAMQWSNGTKDLLATFIPKIVGGSSTEFVDGDSPFAKAVGRRQKLQAPTYWGDLPFTSGPVYYGAVVFFLFVFGLFVLKGVYKWWIGLAVLMTYLLSMGKHFEILNRFLFDHLPMYNKFRAHSSILSVTAIIMPILGLLALKQLSESTTKSDYKKPLLYSTAITAGIALLFLLLGSMFFSFVGEGDAQYEPRIQDALIDQRKTMLRLSSFKTLSLILISAGLIWLFIQDKLKSMWMILGIGVIAILDLFDTNRGYLPNDSFVTPRQYKSSFEPRSVDQQILQDPDPHYRVFDASINTFNTATSSYFHKTIGGYHAAKLRRIQDLIERQISNNNMKVLDMLNTKYFIVNGQDNVPFVQQNPNTLGNAWFVDRLSVVDNADAEMDSLTNFDPKSTAIINKEFSNQVKSLTFQKNGEIKFVSYHPEKLAYKTNSTSDQFAVFSEIWYGPNKGWEAFIDGKKVDHVRVNYLLRGLNIPAGQHDVVFEFKPKAYYAGLNINLFCSIAILLLLVLGLGRQFYIDRN